MGSVLDRPTGGQYGGAADARRAGEVDAALLWERVGAQDTVQLLRNCRRDTGVACEWRQALETYGTPLDCENECEQDTVSLRVARRKVRSKRLYFHVD